MAADTRVKTIIVADQSIHDFFTTHLGQFWDTQTPVTNLDQMWAGLDNGTLSTETEILLFGDQGYLENPDEFAATVAQFSSEALVFVLFYDLGNVELLRGAVKEKARQHNLPLGEFYALDPQGDLGGQIQEAQHAYTTRKQVAHSAQNPDALAAAVEAEQEDTFLTPEAVAHAQHAAEEQAQPQAAPEKRGKLIAVTSSKGGSGKTTVSMCTAATIVHSSRIAAANGFREQELSVCIVDLDIRDGQIGFYLGQMQPSAMNIAIERRNSDITKELVRDNLIYDDRLGIFALLAPKRARNADYLSPQFYDDVIDVLVTMFDVVILDTSVSYLEPLLSQVALPKADLVVFVTNLAVSSVFGLNRWLDEVTGPVEAGSAGISKDKIGVVVNQSAPNMGIDENLLRNAANGAELLVSIPLDSSAMVSASNHHSLQDIIFTHPNISPAYFRLVRTILPEEAQSLIDPFGMGRPALERLREQQTAEQQAGTIEKKRRGLFGR